MPTTYNTGRDTWTHDQKCARGSIYRDHYYLGPCPDCGHRTYDYGGGWACTRDHCGRDPGGAFSGCPAPSWWNTGIQVVIDEGTWCARGPDFVDPQTSPVGYGSMPYLAVREYQKAAGLAA